jgi:hypothetical protein
MNSLQKLLACLMLGLIVIGYGCKKDDDDPVGCNNWATEVTAEANAFAAAGEAWTLDQTAAKCQAYKDAGQDYVDALNEHSDCATLSGQQAELQAAINSIQDAINAIQC